MKKILISLLSKYLKDFLWNLFKLSSMYSCVIIDRGWESNLRLLISSGYRLFINVRSILIMLVSPSTEIVSTNYRNSLGSLTRK